MRTYSATVKDADGMRKKLRREAETRAELTSQLRTEGLLVLEVEEERGAGTNLPAWHPAWLLPMTGFDVEMGLRQLASMLKSGVPLLEGLRATEEQSRRPRAARTWRRVRELVYAGTSFADALEAQGRRFNGLVTRLARVGSQSGELDRVLTRGAEHLERRRNLRSLVVNALVYPIIVVLMAIGVSAFLVVGVIPKVAAFLQTGGAQLPPITQQVMDISDWIVRNGVTVTLGIAACIAAWILARQTNAGHELQDALLLRIPVSGKILRLSATALFARAMETMIASGVPLLDALDVSADLLANRRFRRRIRAAHADVMRGSSLSSSLSGTSEFLPMLPRMAAIGEMTGSLAETFGETAHFHEMMLGVAIKRFSVLIEPVMICITGIIVGFVYIAFFTAIFSMAAVR